MNDINPQNPSQKSLIIASAFATLLAAIILISAVLPAEYGIDPTGLGKMMGLTVLSTPTKAIAQPFTVSCPALPQWQDSVKIIVPAGKGLEYKFYLVKGASLEYSWSTDGEAKLYFDFHGEPEGDKTGYFKSYKESTDNQSNGTLTVPFEGRHGWYWENKTQSPATILLNTKGAYRILGLM